MLKVDIISLFPEMFKALELGIPGRAIKNNLLQVAVTNPRDYTQDKHRTVDDSPYGGGPGMLMKYQPLKDSIDAVVLNSKLSGTKKCQNEQCKSEKVIYLSPQGKTLKQSDVKRLSKVEHLVFLCGRYEGIDERLISACVDEEWSIGDYVLSGGELAAMTMIDAITRLLPGALGDSESAVNDSFYNGLLDYPHYTRPEEIDGEKVPSVLLSGNHKKIDEWRQLQALKRTWERRPDLLDSLDLTEEQITILNSLEHSN